MKIYFEVVDNDRSSANMNAFPWTTLLKNINVDSKARRTEYAVIDDTTNNECDYSKINATS